MMEHHPVMETLNNNPCYGCHGQEDTVKCKDCPYRPIPEDTETERIAD